MIRLSPTMLESFRLFQAADFITPEDMELRLRRIPQEPTHAQLLGTAFHAALEGEGDLVEAEGGLSYYASGGYCFDAETVNWARTGLEGALPEVLGSRVLTVDGREILIGGRADYLMGNRLWDIKTSEKPIAPEKPADSMQWRCYYLIYGTSRINYRHCWLEDRDGIHVVRDWHDVPLYPYPGIHRDVEQCVRGLLSFADARGCLAALDVEAEA